MNDSTSPYTGDSLVNGIAERLKSFSLAILTPLATEAVFTTLPRSAGGNIFVVPDETYMNELNRNENRYFVVCPDDATYSTVFDLLKSKGFTTQPKVNISYWKSIKSSIEKAEGYRDPSALKAVYQGPTEASTPSPDAQSHAQPQVATGPNPPAEDATTDRAGRIVYANGRVDVITKSIVKFSGVPLSSLIALHVNKIVSGPAISFADHPGPSGQPSCLTSIVDHPTLWTPQAVKAAQKMASQEAKLLKREFREKYRPTVDKCTEEPQHTLTLDETMEKINGFEDRHARNTWMSNQLREMRGLKKEVNEMVLEYLALTAHCRKLQKACIAAMKEAYNLEIVLLPDPSFPTPP